MALKVEQALKNHIKFKHSAQRQFKCDFPGCLHTAKTFATLNSHMKVHCDDRPFACAHPGCSYRTKWKDQFKNHMRRHSSRRDFKCMYPQCTESYKSSKALKYHFTNRHGEKTIQCDQPGCRKKFTNAQAFRNHKRYVHVEKIHACPNLNCNYRTQLAGHLASHMIVHEGRNEKISCLIEGCEYKGKNSRALKAHMRRHKAMLKCPVSGCGRYACSKGLLKNHIKLHNPLGRPFQCPLCFKCFSKRAQLEWHAIVHTEEKPFRCGHCEYATAAKGGVKSHISSAHPDLKFPFIIDFSLNERECIRCKVTLSFGEFSVHCMSHLVPVVMIERLEIK